MRFALLLITLPLAVSACMEVKTFADATQDVNEGFVLGQMLRDRCNATGDVDHCKDWIEYKRDEESESALLDYDKALARWERVGPY